jgi:3-hydroxy-9,10-secoandrosta-1,3,5(10)-triene-9,17-dione monooxygenase reductase component
VLETLEFRRLLSSWATGVSVVTSAGPRGATANAVSSLSLDPLLVLVCLERSSKTLEAVRESRRLCINVLAAGQDELARRFATKATEAEKFDGVAYELVDGLPVLDGCVAWVVCDLVHELDGGDHVILTASPVRGEDDAAGRPLVFFRSSYWSSLEL